MKIQRSLASVITVNLGATLMLSSVSVAPAFAQKSSLIGAPLYCKPTNMSDGLINWKFVTHQYGTNYYRGQEINGSRWNNVSCVENPQAKWTKGKYVPGTRTCLIGGAAAIVGGYLAGMGVPATIYTLGLTCFVGFIE